MNIAVPALFVILLVLPGIVVRYAYLKGSFTRSPFRAGSFADEIAYGVFWALVLHTLWAFVLAHFGFTVDYRSAAMLMLGNFGKDQGEFLGALNSLTVQPAYVAAYFIGLTVASGAVGFLAHVIVRSRWFKLDRRIRPLRFANDWYYLISGEVLQFRDRDDWRDDKIFAVWVSAILKQGDKTFLYKGVVLDFHFDKDGNLDRIVLSQTVRRELDQDRPPGVGRKSPDQDDRYYAIEGHSFVLKYSEVETLNFDYILQRRKNKKRWWLWWKKETPPTPVEEPPVVPPAPVETTSAWVKLGLILMGYLLGRSDDDHR